VGNLHEDIAVHCVSIVRYTSIPVRSVSSFIIIIIVAQPAGVVASLPDEDLFVCRFSRQSLGEIPCQCGSGPAIC